MRADAVDVGPRLRGRREDGSVEVGPAAPLPRRGSVGGFADAAVELELGVVRDFEAVRRRHDRGRRVGADEVEDAYNRSPFRERGRDADAGGTRDRSSGRC